MWMTPREICRSYREARDQKEQIGILADLNASSKDRIVSILRDGGEEIDWFRPNAKAGRQWSEEEDAAVLERRKERATFREIAEELHRTETAVRMRYARLSDGELIPDAMHWTKEEEANLLALREMGFTFKKIGQMLERSKNSCIGKYQRLTAKGGR